jgi:glutathione S-transferase
VPRLRLLIGNRNYSSWSMRPWVALREIGAEFEEQRLSFVDPEWRTRVAELSPSARVPVLWIDDDPVWESLAILESLAELFPAASLWPSDPSARRHARAIASEMHAGFDDMRTHMPFNIGGRYPGKGMTDGVRRDIDRIVAIWTDARARFGSGGDLLFGRFGIADAMYAPVALRFVTYGVELPPVAAAYAAAVRALPSVRAWTEQALAEHEFVAEDEPYATAP